MEPMKKLTHEQVLLLAALYRHVDEPDPNLLDREFDNLYAYFFDEMPYGVAKARDGDPYNWIANRLENYR